MERSVFTTFVTLAVAIIASCASSTPGSVATRAVSTMDSFPTGSTVGLVAFSDTIVEFTIVEELRLVPAEEKEPGRSFEIGRDLRVEVEQVLWASATVDGLPEVGDTFVFQHHGWWVQNGTEEPVLIVEDGVELNVGETYLGAFQDQGGLTENRLFLGSKSTVYGVQDGRAASIGAHDSFPGIAGMELSSIGEELRAIAQRDDVAAFTGMPLAERDRLYPTLDLATGADDTAPDAEPG